MNIEVLQTELLVLTPLAIEDAAAFYGIYANADVQKHFDASPFMAGETAAVFTQRIMSACEYIWTIRTTAFPGDIIGDCALHSYNKEQQQIEIGGSLLPQYWGKGYMQSAFKIIMQFASQQLGIKYIIGKTQEGNIQAIALVEKMGFRKLGLNGTEVILQKKLCQPK